MPALSRRSPEHSAEHLELLAQWYGLRIGLAIRGETLRFCQKEIAGDIVDEFGEERTTIKERHFLRLISKRVSEIEPKVRVARKHLFERCGPISERLSLSSTEIELILFIAARDHNTRLNLICGSVRAKSYQEVARHLAEPLELSANEILGALVSKTNAIDCGLIELQDGFMDIHGCFTLPDFVLKALVGTKPVDQYLLERTFDTRSTSLTPDQFPHLDAEIAMIEAVLEGGRGRAHVLIVGDPGVGKSELARVIAMRLGWSAHEVRCGYEDGSPADRVDRFKHYTLGCRLMGSADRSLVIFDEAEDVFVGDHWTHLAQRHNRHKGWTNRLLESVKIPTVWITNSLHHVDPAYVRRFDYVLEMRTPPRSVRLQLVKSATANCDVTSELLEQAASSERLTPADTDRIRRVMPRAIARGIVPDVAFTQLLSCRPGGVSRSKLARPRSYRLPYRLEWINVSADLPALLKRLRASGRGNLAFSGPPGTGKTELARYLAENLDRPLHAKKASDLLGPYVGQTETNIADAFERARQEGAVLLLDEADSLLRDRAMAGHSWEVTQVNELLAQLDGYAGTAILTTNHPDALDSALLRRMDVKLSFGYLRPDHAWDAFSSVLKALSGQESTQRTTLTARVKGLRMMAFGDLVAAAQNLSLTGEGIDPESFYASIVEEIRLKSGTRNAIGFAN